MAFVIFLNKKIPEKLKNYGKMKKNSRKINKNEKIIKKSGKIFKNEKINIYQNF